MGLPELNQYQAAGKRPSSALPQRVGKEYRDRSLEEKIMSDKGVILDFGCKTVGIEGLFQIQNS